MENTQKQLNHYKELANEHLVQAKEYERVLSHKSIGIKEGFLYDLSKIKALIDLRLEKGIGDNPLAVGFKQKDMK